MRLEGKGIDEALQACIDTYVVNPSQDRAPERLEPFVTAPQVAEFVALAQLDFVRDPHEMLVIVNLGMDEIATHEGSSICISPHPEQDL